MDKPRNKQPLFDLVLMMFGAGAFVLTDRIGAHIALGLCTLVAAYCWVTG